MKFSTLVASLALLLCSLNASAEWLLGGSWYYSFDGEARFDYDIDAEEATADIDISGIRVHLGSKNKRNNRFILSYDTMTMDAPKGTANEDIKGLTFDWEFVYGEREINPYWGLGFGLYRVEDATILKNTNLAGDDMSAVSFQIAGGAKIQPLDNLELDASIRIQSLALQSVELTSRGRTEDLQVSYSHTSLNVGATLIF